MICLPDPRNSVRGRPSIPGRAALMVAVGLVALEPVAAFGYIDPGTGSMLLQSLLAAVAAALVFGRTIWHRVKGFFSRDKPKSTDVDG